MKLAKVQLDHYTCLYFYNNKDNSLYFIDIGYGLGSNNAMFRTSIFTKVNWVSNLTPIHL